MSSKRLFNILVFILPINLGYHYVIKSAYVNGLLIDYLIPTLYLQDIVAFLILGRWFYEERKDLGRQFLGTYPQLVLVFLYAVLLSVISAQRFMPAFYAFARLALYGLVSVYIAVHLGEFRYKRILGGAFVFWLIFLGILGVAQYLKQGAVFNNYLFLGEQPYSASTPGIAKEIVSDLRKVPAYGLFRHPNIFGGFLAIGLVWVLHQIKNLKKFMPVKTAAFVLGLSGLFTALSYTAWAAFAVGLALLLFEGRYEKAVYKSGILIALLVLILTLNLNNWKLGDDLSSLPSISKRAELLTAGKEIVLSQNPLFGVGINNQTVVIEKFLMLTNYLRFVQPTHNVYVLLASEIGMLGVLLYAAVFVYSVYQVVRGGRFVVFVSLVLVVLLSSFDHYFLTIHQTLLLFWVLLGIANTQNKV